MLGFILNAYMAYRILLIILVVAAYTQKKFFKNKIDKIIYRSIRLTISREILSGLIILLIEK